MYKKNRKIVILGAGPCGIGAAWHLYNKGYRDWMIYEKNYFPGGLSASFRDRRGFTWDIGGHVIFSHFKEFSDFLGEVLKEEYVAHKRNAWVRICDSWVPYPAQNNIHFLPQDKFELCLRGLKKRAETDGKAKNLRHWLINNFGRSLAELFMIPLNKKMWSYPLENISAKWAGEKISLLSLAEIDKDNNDRKEINGGWGPNSNFIYPLRGGVGEVFRRAASKFKNNLRFGCEAIKIDLNSKKIYFCNGREEKFDILINTLNIIDFVNMLSPNRRFLIKLAKNLKYNGLIIVGIGLKKRKNDDRSWMYFPESKYPFCRVTNLSTYSVHNVYNSDVQSYSSLLVEKTFCKDGAINRNLVIKKTIEGLIDAGLLLEQDKKLIESIFSLKVKYAYPIPTLDRDDILNKIKVFLRKYDIVSKGRFGAFKYEKGNMDDCFMQGYTAVKQLIGP